MPLKSECPQPPISCMRCLQHTPVKCASVEEVAVSYSDEVDSRVRKLKCTSCNLSAGFYIDGRWMNLEDILFDETKQDGCFKASTSKDKAAHYIMSQVFYRELERPAESELEAIFDLPDFTDDITILWHNGRAIGFYSVKPKGVIDERTSEKYTMVTLDSIYVSPSHRRCGAATKLLEHIATTNLGQDVALSTPISYTMRQVLKKFLTEKKHYRRTFWEVEGTGQEGDRKLIWYSLLKNKKLSRDQNED